MTTNKIETGNVVCVSSAYGRIKNKGIATYQTTKKKRLYGKLRKTGEILKSNNNRF